MSVENWLPHFISLGFITGAIAGVRKDRPQVLSTSHLGDFIDYEKKWRVEEREFHIKWGIGNYTVLPFCGLNDETGKLERSSRMKDIFLDYVSINAIVERPYYYKSKNIDGRIPEFAYFITEPKKHGRKIYLKNRKFFRNENITRLYLIIKTPIDESFKSNIKHEFLDRFIQIDNWNMVDVINYVIELPDNVNQNVIDRSNNQIQDVLNRDGRWIIIIRRVPKKTVDQSGRIKIALR